MLQRITANLAGLVRHTKYQGRDFIIVPTVILTEGVHSGSNGPLFYPGEELQRNVAEWDNKPLLVYHAMNLNGEYCSAADDGVCDRQAVGFLRNTRYDKGKLKSDAWIDIQKANKVDSRILSSINNSVMMEVSTGLFTENEETPGDFRGIAFNATARNYQPDHLALLPDQRGACSIEAGCGLLRLNHAVPPGTQDRLKRVIDSIVSNTLNACKKQDDEPTDNLRQMVFKRSLRRALNAWCATGKGGGKDNSCSPTGAGGSAPDTGGGSGGKGNPKKATKSAFAALRKKIVSSYVKDMKGLGETDFQDAADELNSAKDMNELANALGNMGYDEQDAYEQILQYIPFSQIKSQLAKNAPAEFKMKSAVKSAKSIEDLFGMLDERGFDPAEAFDFISENVLTNNIETRVFNKAMRLALSSSASNSSSGT